MFQRNGSVTGSGYGAPGTDTPQYNTPGQAGRPRRTAINNAISGGMPIGGATPFAGAQQTLGDPNQPQYSFGSKPDPTNGGFTGQGGFRQHTQPTGKKIEQGASPDTTGASATQPGQSTSSSSGTNVDKFMGMLNDPQYKNNPQGAADAFNKLGLSADSTGLSSNYGSSPAIYDNGNTIGLPDRYMTKNSDGSWSTTMRSPGGGGGMMGAGALSGLAGMVPSNTLNPTVQAGDSNGIWQQIMQALQVDPRLAAAAKTFTG